MAGLNSSFCGIVAPAIPTAVESYGAYSINYERYIALHEKCIAIADKRGIFPVEVSNVEEKDDSSSVLGGFQRLSINGAEYARVALKAGVSGAYTSGRILESVVGSVFEPTKTTYSCDRSAEHKECSESLSSCMKSVSGFEGIESCTKNGTQCFESVCSDVKAEVVRGKNFKKNKAKRSRAKAARQFVGDAVSCVGTPAKCFSNWRVGEKVVEEAGAVRDSSERRIVAENAVAEKKAQLALERLNDPVLQDLSNQQIRLGAIANANAATVRSEASLDKLSSIRPESSATQYEIRRQAAELADAKQELERMSRERSDFVKELFSVDREKCESIIDAHRKLTVSEDAYFEEMKGEAESLEEVIKENENKYRDVGVEHLSDSSNVALQASLKKAKELGLL